jgi:hypothetical protein
MRHYLNLSRWLELELAPRDAETVAALVAETASEHRQEILPHDDDQGDADHGDLQDALKFGADRETVDQVQADQHHDDEE